MFARMASPLKRDLKGRCWSRITLNRSIQMEEKTGDANIEKIKSNSNEARKSWVEYYKYVGTLDTGMIVIVGSLYKVIFPVYSKFIVGGLIFVLACFLFSVAITLFGMIFLLPTVEDESKPVTYSNSINHAIAGGVSGGLFFIGILAFVLSIIAANISAFLK
jgi:hypothetical protein